MGWVWAAPIQDSYSDVSQKKGSADCNSSSSVEEQQTTQDSKTAYDNHSIKTSTFHAQCVTKHLLFDKKTCTQALTPDTGLCTRQSCKNSYSVLDLSTKQLASSPELLSHQELELLRLEQVEVLAQGVALLHRATVGQRQVSQLVHMLEEEPLNL